MTTPILIIEPVARGFRLEVLASAISAIRKRSMYPIFVITRMDFASAELTRLDMSAWQQVHIVQAPVDFGGAAMGRVDADRMGALLNTCAEAVTQTQAPQLIFPGADDYLDAFSAHAPTLKQRFPHSRISVLMQNTEDLMARELKASGKSALGRQAVTSLSAADATLIAFDDALRGHRIGQREVAVLPDPWHGHFAPAQRRRSRKHFNFAPATLVMAAALDPAAGGDPAPWLAAAERLAEVPGVHLALHGKVRALDRPKLRHLVERFGGRVSHTGSTAVADDGVACDVQLLAAADVMLTSLIGAADGAGADGLCEHTPLSEAQQARLNGFGAAFDHEAARQLVASADALRLFSSKEMALLRDTLERHAQELLLDSFGAGLRAAIGLDA